MEAVQPDVGDVGHMFYEKKFQGLGESSRITNECALEVDFDANTRQLTLQDLKEAGEKQRSKKIFMWPGSLSTILTRRSCISIFYGVS